MLRTTTNSICAFHNLLPENESSRSMLLLIILVMFFISKASNVRAFQLGKVKLVGLIVVLEVLKLFSPSRGMTS